MIIGDWLNKLKYICIMEYYEIIKKKININVLLWNDFQVILLNEKSKNQNSGYNTLFFV